jgi:myo-inositol 2-dehydrogenase / D-chiro-inositol 1-dehydrogenase
MTPRAAIIGFGAAGRMHLDNIRRSDIDLDVVVVVDPSSESRAVAEAMGIAAIGDWERALDMPDLDAVLVCSPTSEHSLHASEALRRGLHVFCEKPLSALPDNARECCQEAENRGVVLQVGFNRRFDSGVQELRRLFGAGSIGRLLSLHITSRDSTPPSGTYPRWSGEFFHECQVHDLDTARYLAGQEVVEVFSMASCLADSGASKVDGFDTAATSLRFASGAIASIETCRTNAGGHDQRVEIHGTEGTLSLGNPRPSEVTLLSTAGLTGSRLFSTYGARYHDSYIDELKVFASAIVTGRPALDTWDGWAAAQLAHLCDRSARTSTPQEVPRPLGP